MHHKDIRPEPGAALPSLTRAIAVRDAEVRLG
jgi:hypothetical protein